MITNEKGFPRAKKTKEGTEVLPFPYDSDFSRSVCSSHDCTGLIPALPSSEAELEAYEEMYQFCLAHARAEAGEPPAKPPVP